MSLGDLQHAIARHIRDALPGHEFEDYLKAARGASTLWRDEYRKGYLAGKEVGMADAGIGGEVAMLREQLERCKAAQTIRDGELW